MLLQLPLFRRRHFGLRVVSVGEGSDSHTSLLNSESSSYYPGGTRLVRAFVDYTVFVTCVPLRVDARSHG